MSCNMDRDSLPGSSLCPHQPQSSDTSPGLMLVQLCHLAWVLGNPGCRVQGLPWGMGCLWLEAVWFVRGGCAWFARGVMLWRGHRKGCAPMRSCAGGSAVLSPTPMFWHGDLSASLMAGQCRGLSEGWQSDGEPGSQLGIALANCGCATAGRLWQLWQWCCPVWGHFGGSVWRAAACSAAWCVVLFLSSLGCMWEPWWWAAPHGAEHGRREQLLPQVVGQEAPVAGHSGTATLLGKGLEPLSVVEPEPARGRMCARPKPCTHPPRPAPALASRHLCPACPPLCHCVPELAGRRRRRQAGEGWREEHSSDASCSQLQPSREPNLASPFLSLRRPRLPAVEDARSIACPAGVLTAGTPPGGAWRPAGPEPV